MAKIPATKEKLKRELLNEARDVLGKPNHEKIRKLHQRLEELRTRQAQERENLSKTFDTMGPLEFNSGPYKDIAIPDSVAESWAQKLFSQQWKEMLEFNEVASAH